MPTLGQLKGLGKGLLDGSKIVEKDKTPRRGRRTKYHSKPRGLAATKHDPRGSQKRRSRKIIYDHSSSSSGSSTSADSGSDGEPAKPSNIGEVMLHSSQTRLKDRSKMVGWTLAGYGMSRLAQGGKRGKGDRGTVAELKKRHNPAEEVEGFSAAVIGATAVYIIKKIGSRFVGSQTGDRVADRKKRQRASKRKHTSRTGRHR